MKERWINWDEVEKINNKVREIRKTPDSLFKFFLNDICGKKSIRQGAREYIRPINYKTDDREVIINDFLPVLNLRDKNYDIVKKELFEYVETFFNSDKFWADPIESCLSEKDKLVHVLSTLWLNATTYDYQNPGQFIRRYTNFLKDNTFSDIYNGIKLKNISTLKGCTMKIRNTDQHEFQETPDAINISLIKDGVEKKLPRVAYGISNGVAYIYGVQGYKEEYRSAHEEKIKKKLARARFGMNREIKKTNPEYKEEYLELEPYGYLSLFVFFNLIKQKGIENVQMIHLLPLRYESKRLTILEEARREALELTQRKVNRLEKDELLKKIDDKSDNIDKDEKAIIDKFLGYMLRMTDYTNGLEIVNDDLSDAKIGVKVYQDIKPNDEFPNGRKGFGVNQETNSIFKEVSERIQNEYCVDKNEIDR